MQADIGGRWGIHQIDPLTGNVTGGTIGAGYAELIDAQVECLQSVARAVFTPCDFIPFDRFKQ